MSLFLWLLESNVRYGQLTVIMPDSKSYCFGEQGPSVTWVLNDRRAVSRIARNWEFELGETYANGGWDVEDGSLNDLLSILRTNFERPKKTPLKMLLSWQKQLNGFNSSCANVSHHYDLDGDLFCRFLDEEMHYSCAYFSSANLSLEAAQLEKCKHIAKKLLINPGDRILDIGCGWGSLAMYLAENYDVEVTGITLSQAQLEAARRRITEKKLNDRVTIKLQDYRETRGSFNRIVSVGMFEHVGKPNYSRYLSELYDRLEGNGTALLHTIGRTGVPAPTNAWITKYIFPGGYIPAVSDIAPSIESSGLMLTDLEVLRMHYAQTLAAWSERFNAERSNIRDSKGEKFCRVWEFYLAISQVAFIHADAVVFHFQMAKQHGVVPSTRDYQYRPTALIA